MPPGAVFVPNGSIFTLRPVEKENTTENPRPLIYLFDSCEITLGRSHLTQIRDTELSRKQLRILATPGGDAVEITQLSKLQPSFVNGQPLFYPWSKMGVAGDSICLRKDQHEYVLEKTPGTSEYVLERTPGTSVVKNLPEKKAFSSKKRRATVAFDVATPSFPVCFLDEEKRQATPSTPILDAANVRKKTRFSANFTPTDLAKQLNIFGSSGKITKPGEA